MCAALGFNMGASNCQGGSIESETALGSGVNVTQDALDMPLMTEVTLGSDLESPCLLNYIPSDINFYFLLDPQDITHTAQLLRTDLLPNADQFNEELNTVQSYIDQAAGFVTDEGVWAVIVMGSSEGFLDYMVEMIDRLNDGGDPDQGLIVLRALNNNIAVFSKSSGLVDEVDRIAQQGVESECRIYRITQCHYEDSQPMFYGVAMGRTSLLDASLSEAGLDQENYALTFGIDKKDTIFRFTIGIWNVNSFEVVLATELHVDLGNIIMQTIIGKIMSGEIQFGGGGDEGSGDQVP
jgi:hypothetical protein